MVDRTQEKYYISPRCTPWNVDTYVIRSGIYNAIRTHSHQLSGRLLDVGAGHQPYRDFLLSQASIDEYVPLDLIDSHGYQVSENTWDGRAMPFKDQTFESVMATEVLEHCAEPTIILEEAFRVLKPGGVFLFTVPFVWPLHDVPYDEYRYTPWALERMLSTVGFDVENLSPTGGYDAVLASVLGVWAKRRPQGHLKRRLLSIAVVPLVYFLKWIDRHPQAFQEEPFFMPGISGVARKPVAEQCMSA